MSDTVENWIREGQSLQEKLQAEYAELERELRALEARLVAKGAELERLATLLDRSTDAPTTTTRLTAELVTPDDPHARVNSAQNGPTKMRSPRAVTPAAAKFATQRVMPGQSVARMLNAIPGRHAE